MTSKKLNMEDNKKLKINKKGRRPKKIKMDDDLKKNNQPKLT